MAAMTMRRRPLGDDEIFDDEVFDRRYYPQRVYKDGCGPRVPLLLTDAAPHRRFALAERRASAIADAAPSGRFDINDARLHRPHQADLSGSAELRDALREAAAARQSYIVRTCDTWKTPIGQAASGPDDRNGAGAGAGDDDDDALSARDEYIQRISTAYQTTRGPYGWTDPPLPMGGGSVSPRHQANGNGDDPAARANAIEAARVRFTGPGARPGAGYGDARPRPANDAAAVADRDAAYAEMIARTTNAWKTR